MIARHETNVDKNDIWAQLAAKLPAENIQWRQQGRGKQREGKFFAPFVAYTDAQVVRERLDTVIPGEWDLTLEPLPTLTVSGDGESPDEPFAFKARLQILGVIREDVGAGKDYKTASTDAFKRAAVRFGIGHELYTDYEIVWVQVDGDGKYAKAMEAPATVWAKKSGANGVSPKAQAPATRVTGASDGVGNASAEDAARPVTRPASPAAAPDDEPACPDCGGRMWDNRISKRNPKAPDYACRDRSCKGVIWPARTPLKVSAPVDDGPPLEEPDDFSF